MKKSLEKVYTNYPNVKRRMNGEDVPLTNTEEVFHQLALFISEPDKYSFNTGLFYKYLKDDDLILGIRIMIDFFQKDTLLIKNKRNAFLTARELDEETLYNQTTFAKYLDDKGLNFTPNKLGTYYRREKKKPTGRFPLEDISVNGTPFWVESTVQAFTKELLAKKENE
ncbi:hypothetical protein [Robertmurraya massiliosenegalensis]|uniref:hypothetical protein n=1 Tax=Robertmurraya massiliosenegalensis TaxID=1287657 RepID=UPI0002DF6249|nr:hypothetical protein [Robertmurraya massiliosenegalensis]